ncbi:MAG: BTAD domain-containing putative transcriptional regulator [Deltaproteobacteria bacterium]|nr:BTAD domain-containing putative transcriptional regulator [Deltaproteobacteria bacterium]
MGKVSRPILTGIYPRKRLFALLDRMRERPVIWVSGPPGCGKTTLVSSYLEARKLPCLWYQLEAGDADPATFFYYLGQAVQKAAPRKRKPLPLLTSEYLQGIPTFTLRYFQGLYDRLKIPGIVVFDNYQDVPAGAPLHEIILNGLFGLPDGINAVLISRSDPPSAMIRLQANHQMEILGWNHLRMTLDESEGMVRLRTKKRLSRETMLRMHREVDGWAAGLVLRMESEKMEEREPEPAGKLVPEKVFDYFASEIFDRTDKEVQEFLLKTAFFPKMTAPMAEGLTAHPSAGRILSTLSRNHYFTEKRFPAAPIYQYHPLFREFLICRAKETFSPEILSLLSRRAAAFLEEDGHGEAAVSLFQEARDWGGMIRLILKNASSMVEQGRFHPLEEWLESLPRELAESDPWLLYWKGTCQLPFTPALARPHLEKAFYRFRAEKDVPGIFLSWSGIVDSIATGFEDFKPLDRWISILEKLLSRFKTFPSPEIELRVATGMFYALLYRQPQHREIEAWADRALSLTEGAAGINTKIQALSRMIFYRTQVGDSEKARLLFNALRQSAQSLDATPATRLRAKFAEVTYYRYLGFHEPCLKALAEGLEISRISGIQIMTHMFLGQGVLSALNANDSTTAAKLLDKMGSSLGRFKPWDACFYHLLGAREALLRKDLKPASHHAELALKFSTDVGAPISSVLCHLVKAQVMHALGKQKEAQEHLAHAWWLARRIKSKIHRFSTLSTEALFLLHGGEEAAGLASLRKDLAIGRKEGYVSLFLGPPSAAARLCVKALEKGIEVPYVQELIRRCNLIPEKPPFHLESWPWPLKIFTLGGFQILKDDDSLKFSRKAQQRPLSMLKALIALGGKEVREDQISDALWPEADGDVAHESFATNLHRLRKLIGNEKALPLREGRLTLDERFCWVDVWAFGRILGQADVRWKEKSKENAVRLVEKAMDLYKGPFLFREIEQPWAAAMSERLRSKFLRSVGRLGQYWQEAGQWEKALDCYQKGLEVDNLAEEFYQGLMICHQHLGRRAEALSVYNRCKRALSQAFGVEPSSKTDGIYRSLLSGK